MFRSDLAKPSSALFRHNLLGILESAIRSSNAQFENQDILNRLDIRLLDPGKTDSHRVGWDVFSLDYHVDVPINTVFTPSVMNTYLKIFNFLWRIKRVEHSLSSTWRTQIISTHTIAATRSVNFLSDLILNREIIGQIHQYYIQRNEMLHFMSNLQHYIMFEVLEYSWDMLVKDMKKVQLCCFRTDR